MLRLLSPYMRTGTILHFHELYHKSKRTRQSPRNTRSRNKRRSETQAESTSTRRRSQRNRQNTADTAETMANTANTAKAANTANAANENPSDESIALWTWLREHDEISLELLPYMAVKRKKLQRGYAERGEAIGDPQSEAAAFRVIVSRGRDLGLS